MNRKYLIGFGLALAVLALLVFTAWYFFELTPAVKQVPPSREARVNEYLALDRWLSLSGIPVRTESSADLPMVSRAEERQIFIQASLFRWTDEAVEYLARWIEDGGTLFLALDYLRGQNEEEPMLLLEEFGIEAEFGKHLSGYHSQFPDYDRRITFEAFGNEEAQALKDENGVTRLVELRRGKGKLIVTGRPVFLLSPNLNNAPNARLAWALFHEEPASLERGWLFIRGTTKTRGLFGSLFRQGNLSVLLVSVLILLLVCFWAVIPVFGLIRLDSERPGKPLRERFLAEGRFLKRYGALEFYREVYLKEIKRRLSAGDERQILAPCGEGPIRYRDFPKIITILRTILERV